MVGDRLHWQKSFSFTLFRASGPGIHASCQHAGQAVRGAWYGGRDPSRAPGHLPRRGATRGLRLLAAQRTHGAQWQSPFRWARRDLHKAPRIGVPAEGIDWRSGLAPPPHVASTVPWPAGNRPSARPPAAAASGVTDPGIGASRCQCPGIDAAPPTTVTSTLHPYRRPFKIGHSGRRGPGTIRRALWP